MKYLRIIIITVLISQSCSRPSSSKSIFNGLGEMAGEITDTSVILQSRLTASDTLVKGDVQGKRGIAYFEWSDNENFSNPARTDWILAKSKNDYIIKTRLSGLQSGKPYFYRLVYGNNTLKTYAGPIRKFRTLPGRQHKQPIDFVVTSCFNYHRFHFGKVGQPDSGYKGKDKHLGYPGLEVITSLSPDFVVFTGDNVYYDTPQTDSVRAKTVDQLRQKWHEQFAQPRLQELFSQTATYWEKDDHDHRFNDSDTLTNFTPSSRYKNYRADSLAFTLPSHELGVATFREQVPVVSPDDPTAVTYRTHRLNQHVQVWFTENRDYRSPNAMPDGPKKTIWGEKQKKWLKRTLLASDAKYKLLISPTPLIGPDDNFKRDNHVNPEGFRQEGQRFLKWITEHKSRLDNFYIVHGDRHWQYHSIDPLGIEEFSVGAIDATNARLPRLPGDPKSTDPDATIAQPFVADSITGGFLRIRTKNPNEGTVLQFTFYNQKGDIVYEVEK